MTMAYSPTRLIPGRMRTVKGTTDHVVIVGAGLAGLSTAHDSYTHLTLPTIFRVDIPVGADISTR